MAVVPVGVSKAAVEVVSLVGEDASEGGVCHAPLEQKLHLSHVLAYAGGRFCLEVIHAACRYALHHSYAAEIQLGGEVWVAVHSGRKLYAVAAHEVPYVAVNDVRRQRCAHPVVHLVCAELVEQVLLPECLRRVAIVGVYYRVALCAGLYCRRRQEEPVVGQRLYLVIQRLVPFRQRIHVVVDEEHIVGLHLAAHHVHGQAYAHVGLRVGVVEALLPHPFECAVASVVDVYYNLVPVCRVLPYAVHAYLKEGQVVPCGYEYGEYFAVHSRYVILQGFGGGIAYIRPCLCFVCIIWL